MSALWITGYLTTVVLGASFAIVAFLRVELWLQSRRIRSRHQHRRVGLAGGASPESVLALEESADAKSSAGKALAKLSQISRSSPSPAQLQVKQDIGSQSVTASDKAGVGASRGRENGDEKAAPPSKTAKVPVRQSGAVPSEPSPSEPGAKSAESRKNQTEGKEKRGSARQANGGKTQNQGSPPRETQQAVSGLTLDELYDREVPTVISSELVDEDEREQELGPDDRIEAEVL
jgi:hypothetical protein